MAPKKAPAAAKAAPKTEAKAKAKPKPEKKKDEVRPEDLIPKVERPDEKAFEARLEAVQKEIDKLQVEQQACNKKISERSGGKNEYNEKRAELRTLLDHWSKKMDDVKQRKEAITGKIEEDKQASIQAKNDLQKMKKSIGYESEEKIDERIATIEFKLWTDTIPLKEEKALLKELSELKKSRPKVALVKEKEATLTVDRGTNQKDTLAALREENAMYFEEKKKVSAQLKELQDERTKVTDNIGEFIKEREELSAKYQAKIKERNDIKTERREAEQEYRAYEAKIRQIKQDRAHAERAERQKDYELRQLERKAEKLDEQPHVAEMTLIEQSIKFCKSLTQAKGTEKKEEKKETNYAIPEGATMIMKKEDRDEEYYFAPTKTKASKSKNKGGKADSGSAKPIKHNAETFQLFDKLKLDAPITLDDIPPLLEKLEEQLAGYQKEVDEWQVHREEMKRKILAGEVGDDDDDKDKDEKPAEEAKETEAAAEEAPAEDETDE